jgi:hypothetical protein
MARFPHRAILIGACSALLATACATMRPAGPTHFYASWNGVDGPTQPVFEAVDSRLRTEPAFVRDFNESMNVHIADGVPAAEGQSRYLVRITIPSRVANRRISAKNTTLAEFSVTCAPDRPQPCVDAIVARARQQPARIGRIVARSPKA